MMIGFDELTFQWKLFFNSDPLQQKLKLSSKKTETTTHSNLIFKNNIAIQTPRINTLA